MKHLINRENYINEYLRISKDIENKLDEGLISTLFGGIKMLLKKDWNNIKCKNPSVLEHLKEIDKSLGGYTMTKMEFSNECNIIRQNVADYFNDILEYKLLQVEKEENPDKFIEKEEEENKEDNKESNSIARLLNLKDNTLLDSLKKYKDNISTACKSSPKLREYADQMLNSVTVFVNEIIINELEKKGADKEKLEKKKQKLKEEEDRLDAIRKKMDEAAGKDNKEALKKLSKERDDAMKKLNITPIGNMDGEKSVETIAKQFKDMIGEFNNIKLNESESKLPKGYNEVLRSDTYIGIMDTLESIDWGKDTDDVEHKFLIRVILNKINTVFEVVAKNKQMFKGVPSLSVQAMMVSLANVVIYGFSGSDIFNIEKDKYRLSLITKCAIDSDATIGFNLPFIDPNKPENGNFFVSIMNQFKNTDISSKEVDNVVKSMNKKELEIIIKKLGENKEKDSKDLSDFTKSFSNEIMKNFRQNITKLFDVILNKASKLKKDAEKKRESEAAKAEQESKS